MIFPCPPCQSNYDGWASYGPPITGWVQYMNPTRSVEAYKTKQSERRDIVRRQLDGLTRSCRNKGCIR